MWWNTHNKLLNHLKMYNSIVLSTFTALYIPHHCLVPLCFHQRARKFYHEAVTPHFLLPPLWASTLSHWSIQVSLSLGDIHISCLSSEPNHIRLSLPIWHDGETTHVIFLLLICSYLSKSPLNCVLWNLAWFYQEAYSRDISYLTSLI